MFAVDDDELIVVGDEEANGVARPDTLQTSPVNVGDHGIDVILGRNRSGRSAVPVDPDPLTQTNVVTSPYDLVSNTVYRISSSSLEEDDKNVDAKVISIETKRISFSPIARRKCKCRP